MIKNTTRTGGSRSGFEVRVLGFGVQGMGFGVRGQGSGFQVSGCGFQVWGSGRISFFVFRVLGMRGMPVLDPAREVEGLGLRVQDSRLRVQG